LADVGTEVIRIIPSLLWVGFALIVIAIFSRPIRDLIPNIESLEFRGFKIAIAQKVRAAIEERKRVRVSSDEESRVVRRLAKSRSVLRDANILWVDDDPAGNDAEASTLTTSGARVTFVTDNEAAFRLLRKRRTSYDLVISDIDRGESESGIKLAGQTGPVPLIFYVGNLEPGTPPGAFAITNRPDELLHYVLDVFERTRS
jgi:hypothetical protein